MRMPPGLGERSGTVVHLRKTLYGLKQAATEWSGKLGRTLKSLGFEQSLTDSCVFRPMDGEEFKGDERERISKGGTARRWDL